MEEVITLENGAEYLILDNEEIDGVLYTLFVNTNDNSDFCFRKTVIENNEKYFVGLDNRKEFDKVLLTFASKLNR